MSHTHRLAVNAYLVFDNRFLLLKRKTELFFWGPPGGRLGRDEDPVQGLKREVQEETGLRARVHQPVTTWFGQFHSARLLSIDYLCTVAEDTVRLSSEHSDFAWCSIWELQKSKEIYFTSPQGFKLEDYLRAWCEYLLLRRRFDELQRIRLKIY